MAAVRYSERGVATRDPRSDHLILQLDNDEPKLLTRAVATQLAQTLCASILTPPGECAVILPLHPRKPRRH